MNKQNEEEKAALQRIQATLNESKKGEIVELSQVLKKNQEATADLSVLPTLKVSDIPRNGEKAELTRGDVVDQVCNNNIIFYVGHP